MYIRGKYPNSSLNLWCGFGVGFVSILNSNHLNAPRGLTTHLCFVAIKCRLWFLNFSSIVPIDSQMNWTKIRKSHRKTSSVNRKSILKCIHSKRMMETRRKGSFGLCPSVWRQTGSAHTNITLDTLCVQWMHGIQVSLKSCILWFDTVRNGTVRYGTAHVYNIFQFSAAGFHTHTI